VSKDEPEDLPRPGRDPSQRAPEADDLIPVAPPKRSLAPIENVPLTKEEVARRRNVRRTLGLALVLLASLAAYVALQVQRRAAIASACAQAESSGRLADIDAALALLAEHDAPADAALRARLHATAVLAGRGAHREAAESLLAAHDASREGASDHRIAATYLALAAGDPERARLEAGALVAGGGPRAAEAAHARALAALAVGNLEAARASAEAAHDELAGSPRHAALLLEVASRAHDEIPALGAEEATALRLGRARVGLEASTDLDVADAHAAEVLAAADATPAERAWAELVRGLVAVEHGDTLAANVALDRAGASPPPGDELFRIERAEGLLALGRIADADRETESLDRPVSADAARRDLLRARRALVHGDLAGAERNLEGVPPGPRRELVEAQIHLARGAWDLARAALDRAMAAPATELSARLLSSALLVASGRPSEALAPIEALLAEAPTSPRIAAAAARVHAATGQRERALEVLGVALEAHPREPMLLFELGRVHARAAAWEQAFDAFERAAEARPDDAAIQRERGLAARALGRLDIARQALRASLDLAPGDARALVALLGAELDAAALDDARRTEGELAALGLDAPDVIELRARYFVQALAGARGLAGLATATSTPELALPRAHLALQAERWDEAAEALLAIALATEIEADRATALGLRAVALARARRAPTVEAVLNQLRGMQARGTAPPAALALMSVAEGWLEWSEEAYGRAGIFGRQALDRDPASPHAHLLLAVLDASAHRDPAEHARAAAGQNLEASAVLALASEAGAARCSALQRYLEGAPEGRLVAAARAALAACPRP